MRIRYFFLLPELVLLFFFVAPIFKRIINAGNFCGAFACVVLLAATWFCHPLWQAIRRLWTHLAGKIGICAVSLVLLAGVLFCGAMSVQMVRAISSVPQTAQTAVVLGCHVYGTEPSPMLKRRLEAARDYLNQYPETVCIVTGGKGFGEDITEAEAMKTWLVEHGIAASRILTEDKSTDTQENLQNTAAILAENNMDTHITVISDGFHLYRATILAKRAGLTADTWSAYTKPLYVPTYWVREWMALFQLLVLGHG